MYTSAKIVWDGRSNVTLQELNDALVELHVPAIVFVSVCMVIGVVGNCMVIYVYKTKFRRSNHRYFILFVAVMDLLACVTGMPFLIASLRLPYLITSIVACKVLRYFHYFVNNSAGLLLVVVSVERFRKICRPFRRQLSHKEILYLCWGTIFFSAVMAAPAGYFFTTTPIKTEVNNITGSECYSRDFGFEIFQAILMAETLLSIASFVVLYGFIIRKLWSNDQFLQAMRSMTWRSTANSGPDNLSSNEKELTDDFDSCQSRDSDSKDSTKPFLGQAESTHKLSSNGVEYRNPANNSQNSVFNEHIFTAEKTGDIDNGVAGKSGSSKSLWRLSKELFKRNRNEDSEKPDLKRSASDITLNRIRQPKKFNTLTPATRLAISHVMKEKHKENRNSQAPKTHKNSKTTIRVTFMLFSVSLMFAISFIPHLTLMIITAEDKSFLDSLSRRGVMVYQVFLRIFILNNTVNPIIYIFCDTKFRKECKNVFWCLLGVVCCKK